MGKALRADGALCFFRTVFRIDAFISPRKESRKKLPQKRFCVLALINSTQHLSNRSVS